VEQVSAHLFANPVCRVLRVQASLLVSHTAHNRLMRLLGCRELSPEGLLAGVRLDSIVLYQALCFWCHLDWL
jgi:hypothetical protein